jgi:hypothetical protein
MSKPTKWTLLRLALPVSLAELGDLRQALVNDIIHIAPEVRGRERGYLARHKRLTALIKRIDKL